MGAEYRATFQVAARDSRGLADGGDLRVKRRIAFGPFRIVASRHDGSARLDDNCAEISVTLPQADAGLLVRTFHVFLVFPAHVTP